MFQRISFVSFIVVAFLGACATEPTPAPVAPPPLVEPYRSPARPPADKPVIRESAAPPRVYVPPPAYVPPAYVPPPRTERAAPVPAAQPPIPPAQPPRAEERPGLSDAAIVAAIIRESRSATRTMSPRQ
jgi:hypothetical protein